MGDGAMDSKDVTNVKVCILNSNTYGKHVALDPTR